MHYICGDNGQEITDIQFWPRWLKQQIKSEMAEWKFYSTETKVIQIVSLSRIQFYFSTVFIIISTIFN